MTDPDSGTERLPPYAEETERGRVRCTVCGNEGATLAQLEHDCIYQNDLVADGGTERSSGGTERSPKGWGCPECYRSQADNVGGVNVPDECPGCGNEDLETWKTEPRQQDRELTPMDRRWSA